MSCCKIPGMVLGVSVQGWRGKEMFSRSLWKAGADLTGDCNGISISQGAENYAALSLLYGKRKEQKGFMSLQGR